MNLFSFVINPFTKDAHINYNKLYEISYQQTRLGDLLVDLEVEHIKRIIEKIKSDPEPEEIKAVELKLWQDCLKICTEGRRCGGGITGLGDMLAALNLKYDSVEALAEINAIFRTKMEAELDATIDLAILRGTFEIFNPEKEFGVDMSNPGNDFYEFIIKEFPTQAKRIYKYGRRQISTSTVAPTGSVSILTATSSGLEPLFKPFYIRRKKINPGQKGAKVDFKDQNGDCWTEYSILHPKFKDWLQNHEASGIDPKIAYNLDNIDKTDLQHYFEKSPWFGSCAEEINWKRRVEIQSVIQKYTMNAISSTTNLPEDVSKEEVANIYMNAWKMELKGITVYRKNSRSGVLVTETKKESAFSQVDAIKRPKVLDCDIHTTISKGQKWNIIVGLLENKPYEVFAIPYFTTESKLQLVKISKKRYDLFKDGEVFSENITSEMNPEQETITRLISIAMRHGTDISFIVEQLTKTKASLVTFDKAIARILAKYVKEKVTKESCPNCGEKLVMQEGCKKCYTCGYSAC
jgi:ribonucleoside-diphosphate reductase alpha chain